MNDTQYTRYEIIKMIYQKNNELKELMITIFKNSFKDYYKLKKILNDNSLGDYLFENDIEQFLILVN
jgi:hypothetical protein